MKDKAKDQKNVKDKKKKGFSIWKAALITLGGVVAVAGIIFLVIFLTGGFSNPPKSPDNIYFADVVIQEDGTTSYVSHGTNPYNVEGNFKLVVSTSTEEFNQSGLELSFPSTQTKYYLMEIDLEDQVSEASNVFYAFDEYGNRLKFASCGQAQATHITNGIVIVPRYVSINREFDVLAAIAPDELAAEVTGETKFYNVGGYTQLIASSTTNISLSSTSTYINVDVPVEAFDVIGITKNGSNEQKLSNAEGYFEVSTESLFSVIAKVTPARAIYKYGKDGSNGAREYKAVIFALDNDVNNSGQKINFVNSSNVAIENSFMEYSTEINYDGQFTQGANFSTYALTGNVRIYARMFKTAEEEDLARANSASISQVYSAMESSELYVISDFMIKEIEIDGFEATNDYNNGSPLRVDINNPTIIYANNPDALANLGITINSSQGSAQNHIRNILISLQFMIGDTWYDATRINVVGDQTIPALFSLYSSNELVTGDDLGIDAGNSYYNFNFYRPIYLSTSNLSYWEVYGRPAAENISAYGIGAIRIYVCYLSPDQGLMLDNPEYGPYNVETVFNDVVIPIVSWNEGNFETSVELGVGQYNDRVFIGDQFAEYNAIETESLANISNMASNPTYKTIRFFIYSSNANLDRYLNVSKYNGTISGVSGGYIYEVSPTASSLDISSLEEDSITFNLIFAVVEDDGSVPTVNADGTYRIISLPTNLTGELISIPFRISKVIEDVEIGFSSVEEGQETSQIFPYGQGDQRFFILQNTQNNLWAEITVLNSEAALFMAEARKGAIVINSDESFYVLVGSRQVPLNEVLTTIFSNSNPEAAYSSIFSIERNETQTTFKIKISTASLDFETNDEIQTNLSLTYTLSGDNLPPSYNEITSNSENFYIYSGKVQNAEFGDAETTETVIEVNKTVNVGENTQFGISFSKGETLLLSEGGNYYLKVNVEGFGVNDTYSIISSDASVVSLSWDSAKAMYRISFLSSGNATLTLSVNFPHSSFETKQISVSVSSNYTTSAELGLPENYLELGIISYNAQIGYEILGKTGYEISFYDLIKIFAISNDVQTDITSLFSFAAIYDNPDDFEKRVTLVESDGSLTGIQITKDFGAVANLTISASNPEIGVTYSFSIVIQPNHQLTTSVENQGAPKPENAPVGSYGVYSESAIAFNNFGLYAYSFDTKAYTTPLEKELYFTLILNDGTPILATGNFDEGLVFAENGVTLATFNGTSLTFSAGLSGVNTLRISDSETPDSFDLVYEIVFYVADNIQLSTEGNSSVTTSQEEIDGEMVTVVNLNNYENSVLNDSAISVSSNGQITFGSTGIALNFVREYAALATYQGTFKLEIESSGANGSLTIGGATIETEVLLKITYGSEINGAFVGKSFYIRLYIAPNITLNSNATTVIYNGKEYVSLYTSQTTSGVYNWFNRAGEEIGGISFGEIAPSGSVISLARLAPKVGTTNLIVGDKNLKIEKTEEGLITTQIVVYYTSADGTRENKVFNVLITPFNWNEYIQPGAEGYYKTEGGESFDRASSDLKDVLSGVYRQTIVGGEEIDLQNTILGSTLGTLIGSSTTRITYKLYRVEETSETLMNAGWAQVGYGTDGRIKLLTQPVAKDFNYRIEFTFISQANGFEDATFVFNYYVTVSTGQKIEIAYPFTDGTQSYPYENGQTIDQIISSLAGNYNGLFEDPTQTHMLYYDQFKGGLYTIDLNSSLRNFNSNSPFVSVYNLEKDFEENGELKWKWKQKLQTNAPSYNSITYSLYKVYSDGQEITANISSFVSVSADGKIEIKAQNTSVGIIIKATTPNLSENYYRILVSPRGPESVLFGSEEQSQAVEMGDLIPIETGFSLEQFIGQGIGDDTLKFAVIDETGRIQTKNDMIYIGADENGNSLIKVNTSPNQQSAILVIYTESLGTLVELDLVADSAIILSYDTAKIIYGDSQISISDLISISVQEASGKSYLTSSEIASLNYKEASSDSTGTVTFEKENKMFNITPVSSVKNVELTLNIWGGDLSNSSEENPCTITLRLTVYPRIVSTAGGHKYIVANDGETGINLSGIFSVGAFAQTKNYQVFNAKGKIVSEGTDEGTDEDYYIGDANTLVWTSNANGIYYVVETSSNSGEIISFRKVKIEAGKEKIYPVVGHTTQILYRTAFWELSINKDSSTENIPADVDEGLLGLFTKEIVWDENSAGAYVLTWEASLGDDKEGETNLVIVDNSGNAVYYSFAKNPDEEAITAQDWKGEGYKYSVSYTWDGLGAETVTINPIMPEGLTDASIIKFDASGSAMSITNKFSVSTSNVASNRTIVLTVKIWKEKEGVGIIGETISETYVLNVKPMYIIEVKYPDYGTGATMESESIYVGQADPTIDLSKDNRVVLKVWDKEGKEYDKTGYSDLLRFSVTSDLVDIKKDTSGKDTSIVMIAEDGKSITSSQTVRIDIELKCGNNWIGVGSYNLILSPTPVLGATFPESSTGDTLSETIPDTEVSTTDPIFALNDGYIKVTMNQNTVNRGVVYFELLANPKYSYFGSALKPVRIYLIGGTGASYAKMYILSNGNTGGEISKTTSVSGIKSFDILGEDNDAAIATLSGERLTFQQAGLWPIAITTLTGTTTYYYVEVTEESEGKYTATYYSQLDADGKGEAAGGLKFETIFGTIFEDISNKDMKDMYEFSVSQQNAVGTDAINQLTVVQPSSKVEFFYKNGDVTYKIPFKTALDSTNGLFTISNNQYIVDYEQKTVTITNKFETVVATYVYQVNLNYSFPEDSFDEVIVSEDNQGNKVITSENSYNKNEFDSFKNETHYVSKTIELDAGKTYSLVNLLTAELGLKTFDGGTFDLINAKFSFALTHGTYTTNSGFTNNLNSLISISKNGKDYIIAPHGAQNGGDIVHLKLDHINPEVILSLVDTSGEKVLNFDGATDNPNIMNLPLSSLVYVNSAIDPSKLQVIVVSGDSAGYVQGEGSNRLQNLGSGQTGLSSYGIVLNAQIKIIIVDEFGYQATDSSGSPAILTIHYRNSDGTSVGYNHEESSSQIFEGDTIEIWAKVESEYYQWDSNSNKFVGKNELKPEDGSAIIVLDNISSESIDNVTVSIAQSEELTQELNGTILYTDTQNGTKLTKLNYISNKKFGSSERISGNNFVITVKTTTETLSFAINPTIMQRYRLEFKPPYNTESILYIPDGEYNDLTATSMGNKYKYFQLYDIKDGKEASTTVTYTSVTKDSYKPNTTNRYNANGFATGTGNNGTITINYNISGASQGNQISVGYQLTQKFFGIDTSGANVVGNYGVVVPGDKTLDEIGIGTWGEGVKLLDYYGTGVSVSENSKDCEDYFSTETINPGAGETVVINVYGATGETNQIGTLRVTRARYYALDITIAQISGGNTLTFSGGTGNSDGWGEVIKAVVSGSTAQTGALVGGLSGFFTYEITGGNATVVYDPSRGEYVINATGDSFILSINYMGHGLGEVKFTKSGSTWTISEPAIKTVEDLLKGGATQDTNKKTITISSLRGWENEDFWLLDLTYNPGWTIYLGNGTNSLKLKGHGKIKTSGAKVIINSNAFNGCSNLTQIRIVGDSLTSIGASTFYGCSSLTTITIPEGVTSIGDEAFNGCSSLTSVSLPSTLTKIGDYTFYNCSALTSITIPEGVTSIGAWAFNGCSSLTSVSLPSTLTSIGTSAFWGCSSLTSITIPEGVTSIGSTAFRDCSSLTTITIPEGVTSIGDGAFNACSSLTSVSLPSTLTSIGSSAFWGCSSLTSIIIPKSVTTIAEEAFNWCNKLTEITINGNITSLGSNVFSNCSSLKKLTLGAGVTRLPSNLFTNHLTNLTEIVVLGNLISSTFPSGIWIKGDSQTPVTSFSGAGTYSTKQLIAVTVEANETSLGSVSDEGSYYDIGDTVELTATPSSDSTFLAWATSLDPNNMKIVSTSATYSFELTEDSPTTYYALFNETTSTSQTVGNLIYTFYEDAKLASVTDTTSTPLSGALEIPSVVKSGENSYKVFSIGDEAFYWCSNLTEITIPEGVTSIGERTFQLCSRLTSITIPESVISIGSSAFASCGNLAAFYGEGNYYYTIDNNRALLVDGGKTLLAYAPANTATSYTIPEGVTAIGDEAFRYCGNLTSITIPEGVTTIRNSAFNLCSSLTSVSLPSTLVSIGSRAFQDCSKLTSITIPEGVTAIGDEAFYDCSSLTSITIQGSIILIGNNVFQYCSKLGSLTLGAGVTSLPDNLFDTYYLSRLTEIVVLGNLTSETFPSGTWTKGGTAVTQFTGAGTYIKSEE